jgi:hypothetical protein
MPPLVGGQFATKVLKLIAPVGHNKSLIEILNSIGADKVKDANDVKMETGDAVKMGMGILSLLEGIDVDLLNSLFKEAINHEVFVGDTRLSDEIAFDNHFQKYTQDYFPVMIWVIWMNVKDFLFNIGDGISAVIKLSSTPQAPAAQG